MLGNGEDQLLEVLSELDVEDAQLPGQPAAVERLPRPPGPEQQDPQGRGLRGKNKSFVLSFFPLSFLCLILSFFPSIFSYSLSLFFLTCYRTFRGLVLGLAKNSLGWRRKRSWALVLEKV